MQNTIDQITDYLAGLVTSNKSAYSPKDLLKANIPAFVVERIRLVMEDKVREELNEAGFVWFNLQNKFVQETWQDFINSAIGASHLPKERLYEVLHAVVTEVIYVFIEPRKHFAEYVFREDDELVYEEVEARCARVTVYKHFATAIPLYMKKRELETLTKERCSQLIHKLDAKLVAAYTPDDWAQKLDQLFVLFGGQVDPMLLITFFEDKGLSTMADKFRKRKKKIDRAHFIDIITGRAEEEAPEPKKNAPKNGSSTTLMDSFFVGHEDDPSSSRLYDDSLANQFLEGNLSDEEMNELLEDIASDGVVEVEDHDHVASLNELFLSENAEDEISETAEEIAANIKNATKEDQEHVKEFRDNLISILDQAKDSYEHIVRQDDDDEPIIAEPDSIPEDSPLIEENDSFENLTINEEDAEEHTEDQPMWAKFLSADQMDVIMGGKRSEERDSNPEEPPVIDDDEDVFELNDGILDTEDVLDEPDSDVPDSEYFHQLLYDRSDEFIKVIFNGSKEEYEQALETICGFESWPETSAFIKEEIFKKNDVDLFSGATVDFTDRMHHHFNERTTN